jgi:putative membrane protein
VSGTSGFLKILVTGLLMGMAEVVPGISGGTVAFISGYYERLLTALSRIRFDLVRRLWRQGPSNVWQHLDGNFLTMLFGGMVVSVVTFAGLIKTALAEQPIMMWSFFFGLVLASSFLMLRQVERKQAAQLIVLAMGLAVGLVLQRLVPVTVVPTSAMLFLGGAIAVCAWILPGISGSFLLLLLGLYGGVIDAVANFRVLELAPLGLGAALGLIAFANVLKLLFHRAKDWILMFLTGLMLGTLVRLWPWQQVLQYQLQADATQKRPLISEPVWPTAYESLTGQPAEVVLALLALCVGGAAVVLFERFAVRTQASAV